MGAADLEKLRVKDTWSMPRYESWKMRLSGRYLRGAPPAPLTIVQAPRLRAARAWALAGQSRTLRHDDHDLPPRNASQANHPQAAA